MATGAKQMKQRFCENIKCKLNNSFIEEALDSIIVPGGNVSYVKIIKRISLAIGNEKVVVEFKLCEKCYDNSKGLKL